MLGTGRCPEKDCRMSGRILLVDSIATNRIVLRAKLLAAHYVVLPCASLAEARAVITTDRPDLIVIDFDEPDVGVAAFCKLLRADPETAGIPIIATGEFADAQWRVTALQAGVDDLMINPVNDTVLHARIRSLLRGRDAESELRPREDTQRALGFAENSVQFTRIGRVAVVTGSQSALSPNLRAVMDRLPAHCQYVDVSQVLHVSGIMPAPDLVIIDGAAQGVRGSSNATDVLRLVADLRSRSSTRHAAQLVILPENASDTVAMALDLGANDIASDHAEPEELDLRVRNLLRRKLQADRLRDSVRSGLQAAVTDSLTGLYNRRYALPHLARMAEQARRNGSDFAVMVLDIDHFKSINDAHGHTIGDRVLIEVAERLRDNLRPVDLIARIGGEEFLVALPDTSVEKARVTAERLRYRIEDETFDASPVNSPCAIAGRAGGRIDVTLSIGVAMGGSLNPGIEDVSALFDRADAALYAAKSAGRNMVTLSRTVALTSVTQ